jgi:tricorn protease
MFARRLLLAIAFFTVPVTAELLRYPAISADRIVFTYGGDLWSVPRSGGEAQRLTSHPGFESLARFSPDGKWIAFSGEYDGNFDAYVIPANGGEPRRLTYHPMPDRVVGWTPDGSRVVFRSGRASVPQAYDALYTVAPAGGIEQKLPMPTAGFASFSPDGNRVAYNRIAIESRTWKRYRGGMHAYVSLFDLKTNAYDELPHTDASALFPMWSGNAIYFISDRDGVMNLYRHDLAAHTTTQLTTYRDYDVKWPSLGGGDRPAIVFEHGGALFTFDLATEKIDAVPVTVTNDFPALRPTTISVDKWINTFGLSPSGNRAVIEARGEIFSVPAAKGDVRNLTNTSGARELWPAWSPDGKSIAYFSDVTGEYELYVQPQDARGATKRVTTDGHAYRFGTKWSPDSHRIAFAEKSNRLFWIDASGGSPTLIDESLFGLIDSYDWSPDSKWIAYEKRGSNQFRQIFLYSLEQRRSFPVTNGFTDDFTPIFDTSGDYLYFLSNRNLTPTFSDFEQTFNFNQSTGIYAVILGADAPSPFAPQSDEEASTPAAKPAAAMRIDLTGIGTRMVKVPVSAGTYRNLATAKHRLFYLSVPPGDAGDDPNKTLRTYDVEKRDDSEVMTGIDSYALSGDGQKVMYKSAKTYGITDAKGGKVGDGKIDTTALRMTLDRRAEWKQIFDEAWRLERDFFYDPTMGGVDWPAMKRRYERELPFAAHRADVNYIIGEMIGELSVSHLYVSGGDVPDVPRVTVGLLGADYDSSGHYYRITKIYRGDNTTTDARSPLTAPGAHVSEGDYIVSVNGKPLTTDQNLYAAFQGMSSHETRLLVNSKPSPDGAHEEIVRPIANEENVRVMDWIESNRRKVLEATGGRAAYIYLPFTQNSGIIAFGQQFYAQTDKSALIVDARYNGGGYIPDFFAERLARRHLEYDVTRDGADTKVPAAAIDGPKALIVNEWAGSGGDSVPDYFRKLNLGPIIGKRTWGGLMGIGDELPMIDGGSVRAPHSAAWDVINGKSEWIVENHGVDPDIEVDARPDLVAAGRDPQLEKAIAVINEELTKHPPVTPTHPPFGSPAGGQAPSPVQPK